MSIADRGWNGLFFRRVGVGGRLVLMNLLCGEVQGKSSQLKQVHAGQRCSLEYFHPFQVFLNEFFHCVCCSSTSSELDFLHHNHSSVIRCFVSLGEKKQKSIHHLIVSPLLLADKKRKENGKKF